MKTKKLVMLVATITLLAITPASTLSGSNYLIPSTTTIVSDFSIPQNIGGPVNFEEAEAAPFLAPSGLSLYFTRNTAGFGAIDIWVSRRPTLTSAWGVPENLGAVVNTEFNENQPVLSRDGLTMLFNSSRPGGLGGADIYMSTRTDVNNDLGWTAPVNLGPVINTGSGEIGAAIFENPSARRGTFTLYFSSNRSGDFDIYQSVRSANGTFSPPVSVAIVNLGSGGNEDGPAVSPDGLEMLFSSDRQGGSGGNDIWVSTRPSLNSPWELPLNVTTINSEFTEANPSHSPNGGVLLFNSDRPGGTGGSDIYTSHRLCTSSK